MTYPDEPPVIYFLSKIALPCVNATSGKVTYKGHLNRMLCLSLSLSFLLTLSFLFSYE